MYCSSYIQTWVPPSSPSHEVMAVNGLDISFQNVKNYTKYLFFFLCFVQFYVLYSFNLYMSG